MLVDLYIREGITADLPHLLAMLQDDHLGQSRETADNNLATYERAFAKIIADPNNRIYVAELDNEIVGTFQFITINSLSFQGGTRCQIESVRTLGERRGQGIGKQMMQWAIAQARAEGCVLIQLSTHKSRTRAHSFYEQLGFEKSHLGMKLML